MHFINKRCEVCHSSLPINSDTSSFFSAFLNEPVISSFWTTGRNNSTNSSEYGGAIMSSTYDTQKVL